MRLHLVAAAVAATLACSADLRLNSDVVVRCATDNDCPSGSTCLNGQRCVTADFVDSQGAAAVNPPADAVVLATDTIRFAWGQIRSASSYTLSVAK